MLDSLQRSWPRAEKGQAQLVLWTNKIAYGPVDKPGLRLPGVCDGELNGFINLMLAAMTENRRNSVRALLIYDRR